MQYLNLDPKLPKPEVITVNGISIDALHILDIKK
jgi:hypothetical protein